MNTFNIIADSPQEAITKARETFGPEAVIQEVRKQPRKGFSRLWKQPRLELVVGVPAPTSKLPTKEKLGTCTCMLANSRCEINTTQRKCVRMYQAIILNK